MISMGKYKSIIVLFFLFIGVISTIQAGEDIKYPISSIPKELKKSAVAVVRNHETKFVRKSLSDAVLEVTKVVSILNKKAIDEATFAQMYDKFSTVKKLKVVIYDEYGNVVKKHKQSDMKDVSAISSGTLFSDARIKYVDPEYGDIPFTVEYTYEIDYSGLLNFPSWLIYPDYNISVENSSFEIVTPKDLEVRYYLKNIDLEPTKSIKDDMVSLYWNIKYLKAVKYEPFSGTNQETLPSILTAPIDFSVDGYEGNSETWETFGNWIHTLNTDDLILSEETTNSIESLINDTMSVEMKVKVLYEWMQNKTRYVSIQVGIGGWQPIDSEEVDKLSYGDCKALTNYMRAVLRIAGIDSYYTLVNAGQNANPIIADFPSNQFNHVILCVPVDQDTVWLECTNQQCPFGYIGGSTGDRKALVISEKSSQLVQTKSYDKNDNYMVSSSTVTIDGVGDGTAIINVTNSGLYYEVTLPIIRATDKERKDLLVESISIPNFEIRNYSYKETKSLVPKIEEEIDLFVKSYGTLLGERILFEANMFNKHDFKFRRSSNRNSDIILNYDVREIDTIVYEIPLGFSLETIPPEVELSSDFVYYKSHVHINENKLMYVRKFEINKGKYPSSRYIEFKKLSKDISSADKQKVVLIRNTN